MNIFFGSKASSVELTEEEMDFQDLVKKLGKPRQIQLGREQYQELPKSAQDRVKDGAYYCATTFAIPMRCDDNADKIILVPVDIDGQHVSKQRLYQNLAPFNWVIHSTASHAPPQNPRYRLIVEADGNMPARVLPQAILTVAQLAGVEADAQAIKISQPAFLPKVLLREKFVHLFSLSGKPFGLSDVDLTIERRARAARRTSRDPSDALEFLSATVDIPNDQIPELLASIDPDIPRNDWVLVCCGMRHQFQQDPETGYHMFDEWSSRGAKYRGPEDTRRQWEYEEPNPFDRDPVTLRTVIHMAQANGWSTNPSERLLARIKTSKDLKELREIMAEMSKDSNLHRLARDMAVNAIQKRFRELDQKVAVAVVRKETTFRVDKSAVCETQDGSFVVTDGKFPAWTEPIVFAQSTGEFISTESCIRMDVRRFNIAYSKFMMTAEDVATGKARPDVLPSEYLMNVVHIPQVYGPIYLPGHTALVDTGERQYVNLYRDTRPEKSHDQIDEIREVIIEHIEQIIPAGCRQAFTDFLAYAVQHPERRCNWAILLQGTQGCGKTFFANMMQAILGTHNVGIPDNIIVSKEWTEWAEGKQFIAVEEIHQSGQNRHAVLNKFKPLITNPHIAIARRGVDSYEVPNVGKYMLFTNHRDAVAIDPNERRYCVIMSTMQEESQVLALPDGYFDRLFGTLQYPGTLRAFWEEYPISKAFSPLSHAPKTEYREWMHGLSQSDAEQVLHEAIEQGISPYLSENVVSTSVLRDYLKDQGVNVQRREILRMLASLGYNPVSRRYVDPHGRRHVLYATHRVKNPCRALSLAIRQYEILD